MMVGVSQWRIKGNFRLSDVAGQYEIPKGKIKQLLIGGSKTHLIEDEKDHFNPGYKTVTRQRKIMQSLLQRKHQNPQ